MTQNFEVEYRYGTDGLDATKNGKTVKIDFKITYEFQQTNDWVISKVEDSTGKEYKVDSSIKTMKDFVSIVDKLIKLDHADLTEENNLPNFDTSPIVDGYSSLRGILPREVFDNSSEGELLFSNYTPKTIMLFEMDSRMIEQNIDLSRTETASDFLKMFKYDHAGVRWDAIIEVGIDDKVETELGSPIVVKYQLSSWDYDLLSGRQASEDSGYKTITDSDLEIISPKGASNIEFNFYIHSWNGMADDEYVIDLSKDINLFAKLDLEAFDNVGISLVLMDNFTGSDGNNYEQVDVKIILPSRPTVKSDNFFEKYLIKIMQGNDNGLYFSNGADQFTINKNNITDPSLITDLNDLDSKITFEFAIV